MKAFFLFLILIIPPSIYPHHTGGADNPNLYNLGAIDPFTGKRIAPSNYVQVIEDINKGALGNKNIYNSILFGEITKLDGKLGFNVTVPYIYYDQKDRKDATRFGKMYLGVKYMPPILLEHFFITLEARLGFPSGSDSDKVIGGDYYTGMGIASLGFNWRQYTLVARTSGLFPLTKLHPKNELNNDGIPYWLRDKMVVKTPEQYDLKKVSIYQIFFSYALNQSLSIPIGFLYRTPHNGIEKERATADRIPSIFREISTGINYQIYENISLGLLYKYPLNRGREFRPYESSYTIIISVSF